LRDHIGRRHAARWAAPKGNNAKRAAMIAAVLDLQERARPAFETFDEMPGGFAHRHDVAHERHLAKLREGLGQHLLLVADDRVDFVHFGIARRRDLGGTPGHDELCIGTFSAQASDRLPRLTLCLGGHGAGVDHDGVRETSLGRIAAYDFGFVGVETAAKGDDVDHGDAAIR